MGRLPVYLRLKIWITAVGRLRRVVEVKWWSLNCWASASPGTTPRNRAPRMGDERRPSGSAILPAHHAMPRWDVNSYGPNAQGMMRRGKQSLCQAQLSLFVV
jgi:hypothetical protein